MKTKSRKLLSALLAMFMVFGLFAAMPMTVSAATLTASNAAELETALNNSVNGDTIRLLADVTYPDEILIKTKKTITIDLNGKTLSATGGLYAGNGVNILLANPDNGQFNVSGKGASGDYTVYASAGDSKIEVTNISTSVDNVWAAYTNGIGSQLIVYGNVTHTGASGRAVTVTSRSEITVHGTIAASPGVVYARVGGVEKTRSQYEDTSSKAGFLEYKTTNGSTISYLWMKAPGATIDPTAVAFDKNTGGDVAVAVDLAGYTPQSIRNGSYILQHGTDFTISGNIVSLKTAYLNTLSVGTYTLTFMFSGGVNPILILIVSGEASIDPTAVNYDKNSGGDVAVTVLLAGYTPQSIKNGSYSLLYGTDFTISGNIVSLKEAYLMTLDAGAHTLTFELSSGVRLTLSVTVTGTAAGAPGIEGPASMSLAQGYTATSSGAFTITGNPAPTVEKTSGDAKITWNNSAKKLDIAAGLTPGTYQVILKAANGKTPDAMFTFTLTVTAASKTFPFTDVPTGAWYYNDVKIAYESGLINGSSATTFSPDNNLTYAEAIKLAACMHQLYTTGSVTLTNGSPYWYDSYVTYAKAVGIISTDYIWTAQATRAGYMAIFANALPASALAAINTVPDDSIPDVKMTHPQAAAIYKLYRAGILQGVDAAHNCNPASNIKRSEVAAILTRMMNADARVSFGMS